MKHLINLKISTLALLSLNLLSALPSEAAIYEFKSTSTSTWLGQREECICDERDDCHIGFDSTTGTWAAVGPHQCSYLPYEPFGNGNTAVWTREIKSLSKFRRSSDK